MSEINKQQTDKQFWSIVENLEGEKKDPKVKLEELAEQFRKGESPYPMDELYELAHGTRDEWHKDGFRDIRSFVDESGRLVMAGRLASEIDKSLRKDDKTWRLLFDDHTMTTVIPKEFSGTSLHFRSDQGFDGIYDVSSVDNDATLPEDLQEMVAKFGPTLSTDYAGTTQNLHVQDKNAGFWQLNELLTEIQRPEREQKVADTAEAYEIEDRAQAAKQRVRKHLFMTARKHARLQEQAYRDSIRHSMQ